MKAAWIYVIVAIVVVVILLTSYDMYLWNKIGSEAIEEEKKENNGRYNIVSIADGGTVFMKNGKYYSESIVQCIVAPCPPVVEEITQGKYASLIEGSVTNVINNQI